MKPIGSRLLSETSHIIAAGFASIFVLLVAVIWLSLASLSDVNRHMSTLINDTDSKTLVAYQVRDIIRLRSERVRSLEQITDPSERESIMRKLGRLSTSYVNARENLAKFEADSREQLILERITKADERITRSYTLAHDRLYSMLDRPQELKRALSDLQLQELVLLKHLNDLVELQSVMADEALQINQGRYNRTQGMLWVLALTALLLGIVISVVVTRRATQTNRHIAHLASHDDLTGLVNRREFEQQLQQAMDVAGDSQRMCALLFMDLDRFKAVNDSCGHHAGDMLLINLSNLFASKIGTRDVLARLGGDEFAIIAWANTKEKLITLAEELRDTTAAYEFRYGHETFQVSLSVGMVLVTDADENLEDVMATADSACYVAKESGRNRIHIAKENDLEVLRYRNDLASVLRLRSAINEGSFKLYYQPVFRLLENDVELEHCEILLRLEDGSGRFYSPAEFIPLAEKYDLMADIDRWVVSTVISWLEKNQHTPVPRLLINLSALAYTDEQFLRFLEATLQQSTIDASNIAFEITETAALDDISVAQSFLARIRRYGCRFALDDFGTGFSTFSYLKKLNVDYLKIDGSLVQNMSADAVDYEMVKAINNVGHAVGALTIAEFVEDTATLQALRELGVDYAQGFGLQAPLPIDQLLDSLLPMDKAA